MIDIEVLLLRALNLDPGHVTSLFNLADLYRWETVKIGGKLWEKQEAGKTGGWESPKRRKEF